MTIMDSFKYDCPKCKRTISVDVNVESWFCGYCGFRFPVTDATIEAGLAQQAEKADSAEDDLYADVPDIPEEVEEEVIEEDKPEPSPAREEKPVQKPVEKPAPRQEEKPAVSIENDPLVEEKHPGYMMKGFVLVQYTGSETTIDIPDDVAKIGAGAFKGNTSIVDINIPSTVAEIAESAFEDCKNLKSVKLPSDLKKINYKTFNGCDSLKTITIPASVTEISYNAMCCGLEEIIFESSKTTWEPENEYTNASFNVDRNDSGKGVKLIRFKGESYQASGLLRFRSVAAYLRTLGVCQHCGGKFGVFNKCKDCGEKKDY